MSGIKKLAPILGTVGGGLVGTAFGNPMIGASLGGALGSAIAGPGKGPGQQAPANVSDITQEAGQAQSQYAPILQSAQANQGAVSPYQQQALTQMGLAATGQGPSLAEAQLRSAQDRGFAQQLAASQAQRAQSPAMAQRQLLLNMGNSNRDLAQQSAIQRLQERDAFLNQANQQQANLGNAVQQNFQYATAPKTGLQNYENNRVAALNANNAAAAKEGNSLMGAIGGGAASMLGQIGSGKMNFDFKNPFARKATPVAQPTATGSDPSWMHAAKGGLISKGHTDEAQETIVYPDKGFGKIIMIRANGGPVTDQYKAGGNVAGPGGPKSDSIATMLSNGEYVVKAAVAQQPGMAELLHKINAGHISADKVKALLKEKPKDTHYGHVLKASKKKAE